MSSDQQQGQTREAKVYNLLRLYTCPDCGAKAHFMGTDFKAPKRADLKAWRSSKLIVDSGKLFFRGFVHELTFVELLHSF